MQNSLFVIYLNNNKFSKQRLSQILSFKILLSLINYMGLDHRALILLSILVTINANNISLISSCSNCTINTITTYTFDFFRDINPVNNSPNQVTTLTSDCYIKLRFPPSFNKLTDGTYQCKTSSSTTLNCFMTANVLNVTGYYNTSNFNATQNIFTVDGITNPMQSGSSGEFQYAIQNSAGVAIDYSPNITNSKILSHVRLTAANFSQCSITTTAQTSTISKITVNLTPRNPIPSSGSILLTFPSVWTNDPDGSFIFSSNVRCTPLQGVQTTITCNATSAQTILVSNLSFSQINNQISFSIENIIMPPTTSSPDTISIQSQSPSGNAIDACTTTISGVTPNLLTNIGMNNSISTVGLITNSTISFALSNTMLLDDLLVITLSSSMDVPKSVDFVSPFFYYVSTINPSSHTVNITNFDYSVDRLPSNILLTIQLQNLTNPLTTSKYTTTITIYRNGLIVQQGSVLSQPTPNALLFSLTPSQNTTYSTTQAVLSIKTSTLIPINGYIVVQYPPTIIPSAISSPTITQCKVGLSQISGCSYSLASNRLNFTSLFGSSFPTGDILITFSQMTTPPTTQPVTFILTTYAPDSSSIDTGSFILQVNPSPITTSSISSSNLTVLSESVISLNFSSLVPFNMVSISIPNEISILPSISQTCSGTLMQSCQYSSYNLSFFTSSSTSGLINLSWGRNIMPNSFEPTSKFTITTYNNGWIASVTSSYLGLTMNSTNSFLNAIFSLSSTTNSAVSQLTINFTTPNLSPSGYLYVNIPSEAGISSTQICSINSATVECNKTLNQIQIKFSNTSSTNTLKIQNITNPTTTAKTSTPIQLLLSNNNNKSSLVTNLLPITNTDPSVLLCSVSTGSGFFGENTTITFSGNSLVGGQTTIIVILPSSFPVISSAPCPTCIFINSYSFSFPVSSSATTFSFSANLLTPSLNSSTNTFTLKTYTSSSDIIQEGNTNWLPKCWGTSCKDCSGSTCLSCYNAPISSYSLMNNGSCTSQCPQGSFILSSVCQPCSQNCKSCINSSTTCTKCNTGSFLNTLSNFCSSICPDFYFADNSTLTCLKCQSPCAKCTNLLSCLSCSTGYLLGTQCPSTCPSGTTITNETTKTCDPCNSNCLTCEIYTFNCKSCNVSIPLYLESNTCISNCSAGLYPKNGVCSPCQLPCKTCVNSTTKCLTCDQSTSTPIFFNYGCISSTNCSTTLGYYVNFANSSCNLCPTNCSSCTSAVNCTSCVSNFYLYQGNCQSSCPSNTYISNKQCFLCGNNCLTCSSNTTCLSCIASTYYYQATCLSKCPITTFVDGGNCTECSGGCFSCVNSTYCLSCITGSKLFKGKCSTQCPSGSFLPANTTTNQCASCPNVCVNCSNSSYCYTCITDYSLENNTCVKDCSRGVSYNGICYPCGLHCANCGPTACLLCQNNYFLYEGFCQSTCPSITLASLGVCEPCSKFYSDCKTCNSTECLSCSVGVLINKSCTTCPAGQYASVNQCHDCPQQCATCNNATYCTSCVPTSYLYQNSCIKNCPFDTIPSGGTCVPCADHCSKCNQQTTQCDVCTSGYFVYQGGCTSQCPQNYVVSYNQSNCISQSQFYKEFSSSSKPVYFPFSIASILLLGVILLCKLKYSQFHLFTLGVALLSVIQLGSWLLLLVVQIIASKNGHTESIYGAICLGITLIMGVFMNLLSLLIYHRYFKKDITFSKWISRQNHQCSTLAILSISSVFSFKIFRLTYSKFFNKSNFCLELGAVNSIKPVNVLSTVSLAVCSLPAFAASGLAMYYSISKDQQFWVGLDTLVVTAISVIFVIIDLYHPDDYFSKKDVYDRRKFQSQDDIGSDLKVKLDQNGGNQQHQFPFEPKQINSQLQLLNQASCDYDPKQLWRRKAKVDSRGYRIVQSEDGRTIKYYNDDGFEVRVIQGQQVLFDEKGYRVVFNSMTGEYERFNTDGFRVVMNKSTGQQQLLDEKGYIVKYDQMGNPKRYNRLGYEVRRNINTDLDQMFNEDGYRVEINPDNQMQKLFDEEGFEVFKNKIGIYQRVAQNSHLKTEANNKDQQIEEIEDDLIFEEDENQNGDQALPPKTSYEEADSQNIEKKRQSEEELHLFDEEQPIQQQSSQQQSDRKHQSLYKQGLLVKEQPLKEQLFDQQQVQLVDFVEKNHAEQSQGQDGHLIFDVPLEQQSVSFQQPPSVQDISLSQKTDQNQGVEAKQGQFNQDITHENIQEQKQFEEDYDGQTIDLGRNLKSPVYYLRDMSVIDQRSSFQRKKSPTLEDLAQQVVCMSKNKLGNQQIQNQQKIQSIQNEQSEINSNANTAEWQKNQQSIQQIQDPLHPDYTPQYYTIEQHDEKAEIVPEYPLNSRGQSSLNNTISQFNLEKSQASTVKRSPGRPKNQGNELRYEQQMLFYDQFSRKRRGLSGQPNPLIEYAREMNRSMQRDKSKAGKLEKMYFQHRSRNPKRKH